MGVEFVEMSEDDRRRVISLLQSALKQQFDHRLQDAPPELAPQLRPHITPSKQRPSERRTRVRLSIPASVEVRNVASGESFRAALGDIGREGCYIRTDRTVTVGTNLIVQITKGQFAFCADVRVVHAFAGKGFGAMFTAVEPINVATLEAWLDSSHEAAWLLENRRKNQRLTLSLPVVVGIQDKDGKWHLEKTTTVSISPKGASVLLGSNVEVGAKVTIANPKTRANAECRVAHKGPRQQEKWLIGLSFALPNREFWKVAFPPNDWSPNHPDAKKQGETRFLREVSR